MRTLVVSHALAASASAMLKSKHPADEEKKILYTVVSVALVVSGTGCMTGCAAPGLWDPLPAHASVTELTASCHADPGRSHVG